MNITVENKSKNEIDINIKYEKEDWLKELDKSVKKFKSEIIVKGFRKGSAPDDLIKKQVGLQKLIQETVDRILQKSYKKALQENNIEPFIQPTVDVITADENQFEASLHIALKPTVILGEYKNLNVQKDISDVKDEEIDEELKSLAEKNAQLVVKEDGVVSENDTVIIDFKGFIDNELFEGGSAEKYSLEIGSNSFIPGFENQLIGLKAKSSVKINIKFPEQYIAEFANKDAIFEVYIHEIKEKSVPIIDDEFAVDLDLENVTNLELLKEKIKKDLIVKKDKASEEKLINDIIEKIANNSQYEISDLIIKAETEHRFKNFLSQIEKNNMDFETYSQITGQKEEDIKNNLEKEAISVIKNSLIFEEISKVENVLISEEDVDQEIEKIAVTYSMSVDEVKNAIKDRMNNFTNELLRNKIINLIKENN